MNNSPVSPPISPPTKRRRTESDVIQIKVKKLDENAKMPEKSSKCAAGWDLYALKDDSVPPKNRCIIKTGIAMEIPDGYYGRIVDRSSMALKFKQDIKAGTIDSDYRGEIGILMHNDTEDRFLIKAGDKIAQMLIKKEPLVEMVQVDELSLTERGSGGFGSTGTR